MSYPIPSQLVPFASSQANPMPAFISWHGLGRDVGFLVNPRQASQLLPIPCQLLPSWSWNRPSSLLFATSFHSGTALIFQQPELWRLIVLLSVIPSRWSASWMGQAGCAVSHCSPLCRSFPCDLLLLVTSEASSKRHLPSCPSQCSSRALVASASQLSLLIESVS